MGASISLNISRITRITYPRKTRLNEWATETKANQRNIFFVHFDVYCSTIINDDISHWTTVTRKALLFNYLKYLFFKVLYTLGFFSTKCINIFHKNMRHFIFRNDSWSKRDQFYKWLEQCKLFHSLLIHLIQWIHSIQCSIFKLLEIKFYIVFKLLN